MLISGNEFTGTIDETGKMFQGSAYMKDKEDDSKCPGPDRYFDFSANRLTGKTPVPDLQKGIDWGFLWHPQDINDCISPNTNECPENSICSDGWHPKLSYTCSCKSGFQKLGDGTCQDIDECSNGLWASRKSNNTGRPCNKAIQCINTNGSFLCCPNGYANDAGKCVDVNECLDPDFVWKTKCRSLDTCKNTPGSFECCAPGAKSTETNDFTICQYYGECVTGESDCNPEQCLQGNTSYKCCAAGSRVNNELHQCVDINECAEGTHNCGVGKCINTDPGFRCCPNGTQVNTAGTECIDFNECVAGWPYHDCKSAFHCRNIWASYKCCDTDWWNPVPAESDVSCVPCFANFTEPAPDPSKKNIFNSLIPYINKNQNMTFNYMSCFGSCNDGSRVYSRRMGDACDRQKATMTERCFYPCSKNPATQAELAIDVFEAEFFGKDHFIEEVFMKLFGSQVTINSPNREWIKRQTEANASTMTLTFTPCPTNTTEAAQLLNDLSYEVIPGAPGLKVKTMPPVDGSCEVIVSSTDPVFPNPLAEQARSVIIPIAVVVAVLSALIILGLLYYRYFLDNLRGLPDGVTWPYYAYKRAVITSLAWRFRGSGSAGYYFLELLPHTPYYDRAMKLFHLFNLGNEMNHHAVDKIFTIYNPLLVTNFVGQFKILSTRATKGHQAFREKTWQKQSGEELDSRTKVDQAFDKLCQRFSWNSDLKTPIVGLCHGTDLAIAEKICETGFASLSSLDAGYFGKGIYFTSSVIYAIPYICSRHTPAVVVSWVLPGKPYPVIESHRVSGQSLMGAAIKPGYNSHFVTTNKNGEMTIGGNYDEIIIPQESQISPAFIFQLKSDDIAKVAMSWVRPLPEMGISVAPQVDIHLELLASQTDDDFSTVSMDSVSVDHSGDPNYIKLI